MPTESSIKIVPVQRDSLYVFPESACALHAFEGAEDKVVLIEQWRPMHQRKTLELPGGKLEPGETAEDAAIREFLEETGITAVVKRRLIKIDLDFSASSHSTYIVQTCSPRPPALRQNLVLLTLNEARQLIEVGGITHAPTVAGVLLLLSGNNINAHTV